MGRKVDPKTATLYCYVCPENKQYVKEMKKYFGSESNYIDALIKKDRTFGTLKNELLKKLEKDAEKLDVLLGTSSKYP